MSKKILKGDQIQMWDDNNKTLAYATSHTLTLTGNTTDISTKDHGFWGATSVGSITWELTAECLYTDNDFDALFDKMIRNEKIHLTWGEVKNYDPNGLTTTGGNVQRWVASPKIYRGYAIITNLNTNANTGENATFSITLTGNGALSKEDNTITDYMMQVKYNNGAIADGMQLFNTSASQYINSGWVFEEGAVDDDKVQIDISDGTLHDAISYEHPVFSFYLSSNVVPENMFYNVNTISEVFISNNIREIDSNAFANSSIVDVHLDRQTNMKYNNNAFQNCMLLTSVGVNNGTSYLGAQTIGSNAFNGCVRLGNVAVGDECTSVGLYAFAECMTMNEVHLGANTSTVGDYAIFSSSMSTQKDIHFYSEIAPSCSAHSFGNVGSQSFLLHNASTVEDFLLDTDMETYYPQSQCDYQIAP